MESIAGNDNKIVMLYFKRVAVFRDKHCPNRTIAYVTLFAFVVLKVQAGNLDKKGEKK